MSSEEENPFEKHSWGREIWKDAQRPLLRKIARLENKISEMQPLVEELAQMKKDWDLLHAKLEKLEAKSRELMVDWGLSSKGNFNETS